SEAPLKNREIAKVHIPVDLIAARLLNPKRDHTGSKVGDTIPTGVDIGEIQMDELLTERRWT
ncbi:MAG: hypothetical protein JSU63_09440, partial [Phycisphaerales bacterium]